MGLALICICAQSGQADERGNVKAQESVQKSPLDRLKKKRPKRKASQPSSAKEGKLLYKAYECFDCHSISGIGCKNGFKLDNIGSRRSKDFIREHLVDPDKHFENHPGVFDVDLNLMPPQNLEKWEIDSLVEYLHSLK